MANEKAINSFRTYLMYSTDGSTYSVLLPIKTSPDLGDTPEMLDATDLSSPMEWGIPGIIKNGNALEFTCNYTEEDFDKVNAISSEEKKYAVWLGATESAGEYTPDGSKGKFEFTGYAYAIKTGTGVNEVQEMKVAIIPSSPIKKVAKS